MAEHITSLHIEGFRTLDRLNVETFGNVNLITGKNNAGKSSVLEAIRILASAGSLRTFNEILTYRDELYFPAPDADGVVTSPQFAPVSSLFSGFPEYPSLPSYFEIRAEGAFPLHVGSVRARLAWVARREDADRIGVSYEEVENDFFGEADLYPALAIETPARKRVVPIDRFQRRTFPLRPNDESQSFPCIYLDPFSSRSTSQMGVLWDSIALTEVEPEIVKALQIVAPDIQGVSVIGGGDRSRGRTAIAKSTLFTSPVPLRTFGDGVNRLFGVILSLCNARNGILLVDEIENGLHYSAQAEIWRTIFRLAYDLNVQVFATSHSWDCVRAFQVAASESPSRGVLVRLSRRGEYILPTTFSESELEIVTQDQIEVR